jgi:nucleoside-diphosphate-sugar epimerase
VGKRIDHWLVTGGLGFIGSHLVARLAGAGCAVTVLDNFSFCTAERRQAVEALGPAVRVMRGDIRTVEDVRAAMAGATGVMHLAALGSVRRGQVEPVETASVNVDGTRVVLAAAQAQGARRFVHVSSASLFGGTSPPPISEDTPPQPISVYGETKLQAEQLAQSDGRQGLPVVIVRPFSVYGPGQVFRADAPRPIPAFLEQRPGDAALPVPGDGTQTRDFTYVDDVVQGLFLAGTVPGIEGEVFHIASGQHHSLNEVLRCVETLKGEPVSVAYGPRRAEEIWDNWTSIEKARAKLGYAPQWTLEAGLRETWGWVKVATAR